jgi:cell division protein ZapA
MMATVSVTIAGRVYRMACAEGEEAHLEELAREVDAKVTELRGAFGEIGDQRLTVMAAVTFADQSSELKGRIARLEAEVAALKQTTDDAEVQQDGWSREVARALDEMAGRIEGVTQGLNGRGGSWGL